MKTRVMHKPRKSSATLRLAAERIDAGVNLLCCIAISEVDESFAAIDWHAMDTFCEYFSIEAGHSYEDGMPFWGNCDTVSKEGKKAQKLRVMCLLIVAAILESEGE